MAAPYTDDQWIVGEAEDDDGAVIIRSRRHVPPPAAREGWPQLVLIGWGYEPVDETGLPSPEEDRQMEALEDAVRASVEAAGVGILAASITGGGAREWRYYTPDPEAFMDALNTALEKHPEYPIEFTSYDDPDWDALAELLPDAPDAG